MLLTANVSDALERITLAAELSWPVYRLDRERFQQRLLSIIGPEVDGRGSALLALHASDLYLATACALRVQVALRDFTTRYLSRVQPYLRRFEMHGICADEVRRELEDILLFGKDGGAPKIGLYSGRGPLDQFVAMAVRNTAVTMLRRTDRDRNREFEDSVMQLALAPENRKFVVACRYESSVRHAVHTALNALTERQRTIVRLHLVHGVTLTNIGRMFKTHQSTVSRNFQTAMAVLRDEIRRHLQEFCGIERSDIQSIIRDMQSRIDLSLGRVLGDDLA